ncbi:GPW/gp25 family protein [Streptomyces sp. NPDC007940]|uniref:GPW/gp25 family protein n=1 Tax=Streptomyces sp. NPDC007940 TaxID=3364796 RepID=UPI0036E43458
MTTNAWTGKGPRFPFRPTPTGALEYTTGEDLIRQSITTILDTDPGERVMLPDFGCGLRRFLMEPNTTATREAMRGEIEDALGRWEPRIGVTNVAVTPGEEPSLVWIDIGYVRLVDRREDNLVYPFYLR